MTYTIAVMDGLPEAVKIRSLSGSVLLPMLGMEFYSYLEADYYQSLEVEAFNAGLFESEKDLLDQIILKWS